MRFKKRVGRVILGDAPHLNFCYLAVFAKYSSATIPHVNNLQVLKLNAKIIAYGRFDVKRRCSLFYYLHRRRVFQFLPGRFDVFKFFL